MDNYTLNNKQGVLCSSFLMKLCTFLILSLFAPKIYAQLDVIHYVPPLYAGTYHSLEVGKHWVVLTTPSEKEITVVIKKGNGDVLATVSGVSKATPKRFDLGTGSPTSPPFGVINYKDLNKVISDQGLIFTSHNAAGKSVAFYVNIRHKSSIHGLSLTAKGQVALGTSFRSGHLYSKWSDSWIGSHRVNDHRSHFISVMATEDNTEVIFSDIKVSNLAQNISNTKTALPVTGPITVSLNAGDSYVIGADQKFLTSGEVKNFNGTKVTSDKPIVMNSGSWCGGSSLNPSQDIGVDQIVPEKLVGQEYILLKGKGNSETERPIVVATQDATEITVNDSDVVIKTLLKAGDSYAIPTSYFIDDVMLIKTNKNAYLYQTTSASASKPYPTIGMNFIPPLSALGFRQVDIPFINELGTGVVAIYAQKGAKVYVNGSGTPLGTPLSVSGNDEWVVYEYSTTDDNVSVHSNKAIYVAMSVFDNVVGAAGYFSGFTKSISPIDPNIVFSYELGYVCSSQEGNLELELNSTPIPDWYEWYHDIIHPDSIKFKNENLLIPVPTEATKYILKAYFRDPNMDILYNGDFAIGRGSFASDLDLLNSIPLDPGKGILTFNPESVNSRFENFTDLDGVGKMLLAHSSGSGNADTIWQKTIINSVDIPDRLFVLKLYGRLAKVGTEQYLDIYVNDEKIYTKFRLNNTGVWQSVKAFWKAGEFTEKAKISIVDANASGKDAVFALDSITFVPAIEATKEFNPDVVPSYSYTPYDQGLHICKGSQGIADISFGDMEWFTFLWEKGVISPTDTIYVPITDTSIEGITNDTLKFNNVVEDHAGIYKCTIGFKETYAQCGIDVEPTSVLVEVFVDEPASMDPLKGKTELCEGTPTDVTATIRGDFSVIKWSVFREGETTAFETKENNLSVFNFNFNKDYIAGSYIVRCEVINGCSTDLFEEIGIEIFGKAKLEDLIIPTSLCEIKEITLEAKLVSNYTPANSTLEYSWYKNGSDLMRVTSVPTYNLTPDIDDESYRVAVATTYAVGEGLTCEGNSIEESLVNNPIDPEIKIVGLSPVSICEGEPQTYLVELETTSDSYVYNWDVPDAAKVDKQPADFTSNSFSLASVSLDMAGDYTITVSNNCDIKSSTSTLSIKPKSLLTGVSFSKDGPYCSDDIVTVTILDEGFASAYIATNTAKGITRDLGTNKSFDITVDALTEGGWKVTAINDCDDIHTSFTIDLVDSFILKPIVPIKACVGGNVSLKAIVETPPAGLTYQWKDQLGVDIAGEISSVLEFNPVKLTDAGEYTCVVSDGICSTQQATGTLSVDDITSDLNPGSVDKCEGLTHRFEVSYVGNPTFAWFFENEAGEVTDLLNTGSFHEISSVAIANDGLYYCVINSACGEERFEQELNVLKSVTVTNDPSVILDICEGEQTELIINVTGTPNTIKWFNVNGDEMAAYAGRTRIPTGVLAPAKQFHYTYKLTGTCGSPEGYFDVTAHASPLIKILDKINGCEGDDIPLSMAITTSTGHAATDYTNPRWLKPDGSLLGNGLSATISPAVYPTSSGDYTAKISSNYCGDATAIAKVNVYKPIKVVSNSELNPKPCIGKLLSLVVNGEGDGLSYKWTKGGLDLGVQPIANVLNLGTADLTDDGAYKCELLSDYGCTGDVVDFIVDVRKHAKITLQPTAKTPCEDDGSVTFTVAGTAEGTLSYKWYDNKVEISDGGDYSGATTEDLVVTNLLGHDTHLFHCEISGDFCDPVVSNRVSLNVIENVSITTQPANQNIDENQDATFSVVATGGGSITYQWYEDKNDGNGFVSLGNTPVSAKTASLTIASVPFSKNGYKYHCVVTNGCVPDTSDPATLTVNIDNRITSTILNAEACEGSSFTFTIDYKNTTDACIWEYDDRSGSGYADASGIGTIASGGTSSTLTVTTATTAMEMDSWKFRARVQRTGYVDNVSNEATVKVYEQVVFDNIADATLCPNTGGSFNVNMTAGTSPYTYEWTRVGSGEVLGSSSNLSLSDSEAVSEEYNVKVSNSVCLEVNQKFNITRHPDLVLTDLVHASPLCIDADINLSAILTEGPALAATYVWTKDGGTVGTDASTYGESGSVTTAGSSIYKVVVTDNCTSKTSSIPITVLDQISLAAVSPANQDVCEGVAFALQVNGTGDYLEYKWSKINALGGTILVDNLSPSKDYQIGGLTTIGPHYYRCDLSSTYGCTPDVQEFTVNVLEDVKLDPLLPITICEDLGSSNFTVTVTEGTPLSYQWYDNNVLMPGKTAASLLVDNVLANNGHNYHCIVTGVCKDAESNKALFTVNEDVSISIHPVDVSVVDFGTTSFSVEASGTGSLTYQWFEKTTAVGAIFVSMGSYPTAKTSTLILTSVPSTSDGYQYRCEVSGTCDPAISNPAKLTVNTSIKIIDNPKNTEICEGSPFTFEVKFKAVVGACSWEYDDGSGYQAISAHAGISMATFTAGDVSNILTINPSDFSMDGWKFKALIDGAEYSSVAEVKIYQKVLFDDIVVAPLCIGSGKNITVNVTAGTEPLSYEWSEGARDLGTNSSLNLDAAAALNGTYSVSITNALCPTLTKSFDISHHPDLVFPDLAHTSPLCIGDPINLDATPSSFAPGISYTWTKDAGGIGSNNPIYSDLSASVGESGIYKVVVEDMCTSKTSSISIDVVDAISLAAISPVNQDVCEGEPFDLQVQGTGDNLVYNWYKIVALGGAIDGASLSTDKDYHIDGLTSIGENYYRCILSSTPDCTRPELDFTVNVQENVTASVLTPIEICQDVLPASEFSVTATGEGPFSYQWYDNDVSMGITETNASLSLNNVLTNNGHNYHCVVGGKCKSATSNKALFTVNENVRITSHPVNKTVDEMGSAIFTVAATGTGLTYQWFVNKGGVVSSISGATTNTLSLTSVLLTNSGNTYYCEVSGTCVDANSNTATLTVVKENRILVQAEPAVVCEGNSFAFEVQYKNATSCDWEYDDNNDGNYDPIGTLGSAPFLATSSTLTVTTATDAMNSWKFRAVVKRTGGYEDNISNEVGVRVDIPASFADIASVQLCNGDGASFAVSGLTGSTPNTYEWTEGARNFGTNSSIDLIAGDATNGTYSVGVTAGVCPAIPKSFSISHYPDLALADLVHANELCPTDDIALSIGITTGPAKAATYSWFKDNLDLGVTTAFYNKEDVSDSESGLYKVTVQDECMLKSKSIQIDVLDIITKVSPDWTNKQLCVGDALLFEAIIEGDNPTYTWTVPAGVTPPVNVATFKVDAVTETNEGVYTCVVTGTCGDPVIYTASVVVDDDPNITKDLDLSAVCVGKELKLGPIAYDLTTNTTIDESILWKFNNVVIDGETGLSLDLGTADLDPSEKGNYRVEVSNVCGTDFSIGYQDIHPLPTLLPIDNQTACQGGNVIFKAVTTGENLIYRWLVDGAPQAAFDDKSELVLSNVQPEDTITPITYAVECIVSSCGTDKTATANLTVNPNTILKKSIKGDVVYVGEDYEFKLEVTGSNLNFEWHHVNTSGIDKELVGEITKTLEISNLSLADAGEYYCTITGDCGVRFTSGYLAVKDPIKLITGLGTANIEKCFGEPLNLNISVEGKVFSIDWYKGTTPLGHHELNYSIPSLDISDSGNYRCEIRGEGANLTEEVNVTVYQTTVLKSHLTDKIICELEDLQWIPNVSGSLLTYEWKRDGNPISNQIILEILNTPMDSAGVYSVDISGKCGNVSSEANLSLNKLPFFISKSDDIIVCENYDEIVFSVVYGGDNLEYQWQKDNTDIDGAKSSEFKLQNISVSDAGEYKCVVSSSCGLDKHSIMKLEVIPQLKILSESPGMEICDGEDAQFMIEVDGNDVVYQWQKDGLDIDGEITPELTINPASLTDVGYYSCAVTDKCTTTERYSNSKKLTVNALPNSQIFGRMTLCVLEDRVAYNTDLLPNINYGWLVDGGEFTTPAEGLRTKITWGNIVEGSKIGITILNEATGCSSKLDSLVTLRELPDVSLANFPTYGVCKGEDGSSIDLDKGLPAGGIYWIDGVAENEFNPSQRGNGEYQVRYSYTDEYGCSNRNKEGELVLKVDSLPIVKIMDDVTVGSCGMIQLRATTEEDNIKWSPSRYLKEPLSKTPNFTAGETTLYVVEVEDKYGCIGNDIINVTVAPLPTIKTIRDTTIGECKEIELTTIISGDTKEINWTNASDLDEPNNSNPKLTKRHVGVNDYQINVTDKYGCVASGSVKVEVLPNPEIGENVNLCEGETLLVDTKDLSNPVWSDGYPKKEEDSVWKRTIDKPGEYELTVAQNDCELIQKIVMNPPQRMDIWKEALKQAPRPGQSRLSPEDLRKVVAEKGIFIFKDNPITLEPNLDPDYAGTPDYEYEWSDESTSRYLEVSESGVYKLEVKDNLGCILKDSVKIVVKPIGIEAPNAFTPNGSGEYENQHFFLKGISVIEKFEMYIYNRWGELMYKTTEAGYGAGWDGTYRGEACPVGTYVWILMLDGELKEKGTVTLLR